MNILQQHRAVPCDPNQFRDLYKASFKRKFNELVTIVGGGRRRGGLTGRAIDKVTDGTWRGRLANHYEGLAVRAEIYNPQGRGSELAQGFRAAIEDFHTDDFIQSRNEIYGAARRGDQEALQMRSEIVKESVQNMIFATSSWLNFLQTVDLPHNGVPYLESNIPQEVKAECIGPDGLPRNVRPVKLQQQSPIDLCTLATQTFEYPTRDLYKGFDVRDEALAQVDLSRDLNAAFDLIIQQMILVGSPDTRLKAAFTTTGAELDRDYYTHGNVETANFPAGNYVTLTSNTATSQFRKECLDEIMKYVGSWGSGAFPDGDLAPVEIIIPSGDGTGWLDAVQITNVGGAGGHSNPAVEQILSTGALFDYAGHRFSYRYDNTLSPTPGTAYVRMNKPIGYVFTKTSMDETIIDNSPSMRKQYKESICLTKVYGAGFLSSLTPNIFAIKYRD